MGLVIYGAEVRQGPKDMSTAGRRCVGGAYVTYTETTVHVHEKTIRILTGPK